MADCDQCQAGHCGTCEIWTCSHPHDGTRADTSRIRPSRELHSQGDQT